MGIGFAGDHKISLWPSGTVVDPNDDEPIGDGPVAYTLGTKPKLFGKVQLTAIPFEPISSFDVRIDFEGQQVALLQAIALTGDFASFRDLLFTRDIATRGVRPGCAIWLVRQETQPGTGL